MSVSVCTIARGRETHLRNLVQGLARQTVAPSELVIARMQPEPYRDLPLTAFPVRQVAVPGQRAPLAAARNAAARLASSESLVFLDVDVVPLPGLVAAYRDALAPKLCAMGETRYLAAADRADQAGPDRLWRRAVQHPARTFGDAPRRIAETTEFWSLSFALQAATFRAIGGFDDRFEGYGGEDTDFALRLGQAGVALHWVPAARAVHQWHAVEKPPLTHLADIVRNATLFHEKHGRWCMDYWLTQLRDAGYVDWGPDRLRLLRTPSLDEREAARCDGSVRFS